MKASDLLCCRHVRAFEVDRKWQLSQEYRLQYRVDEGSFSEGKKVP